MVQQISRKHYPRLLNFRLTLFVVVFLSICKVNSVEGRQYWRRTQGAVGKRSSVDSSMFQLARRSVNYGRRQLSSALRFFHKDDVFEAKNEMPSSDVDEDDSISSKLTEIISELRDNLKSEKVMNMLAKKLLSEETSRAVKKVRNIIKNFPDIGIVDIFNLYPTKDVVNSILALSRLQNLKRVEDEISERKYDFSNPSKEASSSDINKNNVSMNEPELLCDLAHYAVFANAAYGWKMGLFSRRPRIGNLAALTSKTGIGRRDVIAAKWGSKTHRPAYFLVRDTTKQKIVLCIRGTLSATDILTNLCCTAENFFTHDDAEILPDEDTPSNETNVFRKNISLSYKARAHLGMLAAAKGIAKNTRKLIASELASNPNFDLVIIGHSLGGGTAAVLGTMWQDTFPGLVVYAYGCPCVGPLNAQPTINKSIVSVIGEGDPFSCLSLGHLVDISSALSILCENHSLLNEILERTQPDVTSMSKEDRKWSYDTMQKLQECMTAEKLYPSGRILHMGGNLFGSNDGITLKEVSQDLFHFLQLHRRMLDLSQHIPHRYEGVLSRLCSNVQNSDY